MILPDVSPCVYPPFSVVDDTRFHDGSSYEKGFEAGWEFRPHHEKPECPYRKKSRASRRWHRGFRAGQAALLEMQAIPRTRSAEESARLVRDFLKGISERRSRADSRAGINPNP